MEDVFAPGFKFADWINEELASELLPEQHVSSLLIKLTLLEQDLEASLEYKCGQVEQEVRTNQEEIVKLAEELQDIDAFIRNLETDLEFFKSPELSQIGDDHILSERSTECKTALQEIEFHEKHSKEVKTLLAASPPDLSSIAKLLSSMRHSLKYLERTPGFPDIETSYTQLEAEFMSILNTASVDAVSKESQELAQKLSLLHQMIGKESDFLSVFLTHWKGVSEKEPGFHMELGLQDSLQRITSFIDKVLSKSQGIFGVPGPQVEIVKFLLPEKSISRCFLELPISEHLSAYENSLIPLFSFVKNTTKDLTPLHTTAVNLSINLPEREALYLRATFKTVFAAVIKPEISGKVPNETWGLQVVEETRRSWQRCLAMSYGVAANEWAEQISTVLEALFSAVAQEVSRFSKSSLNGDLDLSFPQSVSAYDFDWRLVQRAIQQYEMVLTLYSGFLAADSQCRHEFLQSISTTYFSAKHELDKELQHALVSALAEMYKGVQYKARALREGAHFFPPAIKKLESLMSEAKTAVLKVFYSPVYPLIAAYSSKSCWTSVPFIDPDLPRFSLSQTDEILQIGEHFLLIPQGKASAGEKTQYTDAFSLEFALIPDQKEQPFSSLGQQFWVMVLGNSLLSLVMSKVMQIKELSSAGAAQLAMDIEYLLKVTRSFAVDTGLGVQTEALGTVLKHLRGETDPNNVICQALSQKMMKK